MNEPDDLTLLYQYVRQNSDDAFAELVSRRVDFVYSAALRQVRDPHLAEEITQAVFIILAQKAGKISDKTILTGWFFRTTRFVALAQIRAAAKQSLRTATMGKDFQMQTTNDESPAAGDELWHQLAPLLDAALAQLGEADRQAVLLRFFENKSLAEVGHFLGLNEDTARKRVARALEKLHRYFNQRGVSSTTAIIAGMVSANSVQAAPAGLAKTISAVSVVKGAAASASTLTLIKGALKIMAWSQTKIVIATGVGILLAVGITSVTIKEIRIHHHYSWQVPKASFDMIRKTPPQIVITPTIFTTNGGSYRDYTKGGGAMGICQPVTNIVRSVYAHDIYRMIFAPGLPEERYDFFAKLSDANPTSWQTALKEALKSKLGVIGKLEIRETDVLLLRYKNPNASGLKPSGSLIRSLNLEANIRALSGTNSIARFVSPISNLQDFLEVMLEIPVVDQTRIKGLYDFKLTWDNSDQTKVKESIKQSLLDQFGLELVPSHEPIEMLVVEKAQ